MPGRPRLAVVVLLAALVLALSGCGGGADGLPAGPSSERLTPKPSGSVEGAPLGYGEYLPPGYGDGTPRPLLVFLHGSGENGDGSEPALRRVLELGIPPLLDGDDRPGGRPFIVLAPQYPPEAAEGGRLGAEIDSFLDFALARYEVDRARVHLTGISCGGIGVWGYVVTHGGETVAAVVPIAAHAVDALATGGCRLARMPIWAFHRARDDVVPERYIAGPVDELRACAPGPADLRLTVYPGADHDAWSRTYDREDVYAWLLGRRAG